MWYEQYQQIKRQYPNHIILMKIGDFYEAFDGDAQVVADELGLNVVTRSLNRKAKVQMAGFPVGQSGTERIEALQGKGYGVAVAEPIEGIKDKGHSIYQAKEAL